MLTQAEANTVHILKKEVLAGRSISHADKQFLIDLVAREGLSLRPVVLQRAKNSGLNTHNIKST